MRTNPYASPAIGAPRRYAAVRRPLGLSILAVLQFLGGMLVLGALCFIFVYLEATEHYLRGIGLLPALVVAGLMLTGAFVSLTALGMWFGARWGWWLGAFFYAFNVVRSVMRLGVLVLTAAGGPSDDGYVLLTLATCGGRMIIHSLILCYLFKANVLRFFRLQTLNKPMALGILVVTSVAMVLLVSIVALMALM